MLSPKTQTNLANAKSYFREHLCLGDYYAEGTRVQGQWMGAGAALLGLSGAVQQHDFLALCENRHPEKGTRLTVRHKTTRRDTDDTEVANRRVFYDFTFSPPKSVSIAALVGGDERIVEAHENAVRAAVAEFDQFATAQVHVGAEHRCRPTGNVAAALFQHETSRALDPHLHTHCIVFNATHDAAEDRWKALQNYELLRAQKYLENVYYHALAHSLQTFGYTVVNAARGDFELAEISPALRKQFSKRHHEIDQKTQELLALQPEKMGGNVAAIREHIAHRERERKLSTASSEALREHWGQQMGPDFETGSLAPKCGSLIKQTITAAEAVNWAEAHLFERRSVVPEHEIWRQALTRARGANFSLAELKAETTRRPYVRGEDGKISTREVLAREWQLVELVREGTCRFAPIANASKRTAPGLAADQQMAFDHLLSSADFVTLFRGGAGTGKSFVLRRVQEAIAESGHATLVLAPQRQQVLDLARDGFTNAQTVSEFLQRSVMERGAVVIVDEAGQIGGKQLLALVQLVQRHGGRMILSGDTRQHGPVEVSDALRAIERYSGLRPAELNEIRRQDPSRGADLPERERITEYRKAVLAASAGDPADALEILDRLGAVVECPLWQQAHQLADQYQTLAAGDETVLVVSQTRAEVRAVNEAIREKLIASGSLGGTEGIITALNPVDLTAAQKADPRFYPKHCVAVLNRATRHAPRGTVVPVVAVTPAGVALNILGKIRLLARRDLDRITICQPHALALRKGDRIQLKANASSTDGRKVANGEVVAVAGVKDDGAIHLENGRVLPPSFRQLVRGYAVTSYGSQGKTVDHLLFADSGAKAATNAEQWYVTISRGRKSVRIFTADKAQLASSVRRRGHRELAIDLHQQRPQQRRHHSLASRLRRGRDLARQICQIIARRRPNLFVQTEHPNL